MSLSNDVKTTLDQIDREEKPKADLISGQQRDNIVLALGELAIITQRLRVASQVAHEAQSYYAQGLCTPLPEGGKLVERAAELSERLIESLREVVK